jgi:hypothetical protein
VSISTSTPIERSAGRSPRSCGRRSARAESGPGRPSPDADPNDPNDTTNLISSRQVLRWATLDGAKVAGIADRTGSITPGKKADLVIIETKSPNVAPVIDPVATVVCAADISNVDTVIVDGKVLKRDGKLLASLDGPRRDVNASRDYLVGTFGEPEPGWLPQKAMA